MGFDFGILYKLVQLRKCRLLLERVDIYQNYRMLNYRKHISPPLIEIISHPSLQLCTQNTQVKSRDKLNVSVI